MANGMSRIINAELVDSGVKKGRKGLKGQLEREFSPERITRTKPEQFKKKKARK